MTNYKRLCVTVSCETYEALNLVTEKSKIQALNKSAIVELALKNFLDNATAEAVAGEISNQIMGVNHE